MSTVMQRTLIAVVVVAAAAAPSGASAGVGAQSPGGVATGNTRAPSVTVVGYRYCHRRAGRCVPPANVPGPTTSIGVCHRSAGRCIPPAPVRAGMTTVGVCHRRAGRCVWPTNDQVGTTTLAMCHRHAGRCVPAVVHAGAPRADRALATAAATQGFQWRDAGVGAVGMLLLLAAAAAMVAGRRQHHRVTTS